MKRPSRHSMVQGATLLLVVGCAVFFTRQLATLSQAIQARQTAEQIQSLQQQLQRVDHELEGIQPFKGVLKEEFQQAQQSLGKRLDLVETAARSLDALALHLAALNDRVQSAEGTLLALKASGERCSSVCPATAVSTHASARPKARVTTPAARQPSPPPFTLLGLESRAGEAFLAVLPKGLQRLADVHLLRPGMLLQGWRLTALDTQAAHWVKPDGRATSVSIP